MSNLNTSQMLPVGTVLDDRYRIERYLASGGFGNTYEATDTRFSSRVAVKEFFMRGTNHRSPDMTTVEVSNADNREGFLSQLDKFKREARRIFNIRNDHVVHVIDLFDANGTSYYVMDLIEGESLSARVKRGPMSEAEVRNVADQLLDALAAVHNAGFNHLDVKPANIMMDDKGHCTLIDFGASKQMSAEERTTMSTSGIAYTPGYAPIEQEGMYTKNIGPWTDFYAMGATLYHLLTQKRPPEIDPDDIEEDSRMFDYSPGVSLQMQQAISRMMNPSRRRRPQNVKEMRALLAGKPYQDALNNSEEHTIIRMMNDTVEPDTVTHMRPSRTSQETDEPVQEDDSNGASKEKRWLLFAAGVLLVGVVFLAIKLFGGKSSDNSSMATADSTQTAVQTGNDETKDDIFGNQSFTEGYVFTSNLKTYSRESLESKVKSDIAAGRVAIAAGNNIFNFSKTDEYIILGSGAFHKYNHEQDGDSSGYISSSEFEEAVRKVKIYKQMPTNWELGKVYSFNAVESGAYIKVKALRLSGNNVTLVTNVDDNFKASSTTNISGETLFFFFSSYDTFYVYKGDQVVPAKNTSGDWCDLVVDDKGLTYSKSEDGVRQIDTELSYVFGEYPGCELFGWISDTEIVLDDVLYVASSTSR